MGQIVVYTNNEEDYLRLSVWSFRGKTKSTLNNYLRYMTTNYKTSFLLPHDYEIPTFNYPQYVLPPVPYNYEPYTKDIWDGKTGQALITKITAPAQCKKEMTLNYINLFSDEFNEGYCETEIDLKQIDPTIQSISKFQDAYKTIEISNLNNLQVRCFKPDIERFIYDRDVNLSGGVKSCTISLGTLNNAKIYNNGLPQTDNVNFENTITLYTDNINNDIQTFTTAYTTGLPSENYQNIYITEKHSNSRIKFLLQITKLSDNINDKIKKTYLQAYYTNDLKLKIRFSKVLFAQLGILFGFSDEGYVGNDKDITIDLNALGVLGIRNKSTNPVKITIKPR
ncbi:hypothetical protein [Spiroplasma sp. Moj]|uniref:hypothetical protein n=1 Tax=Spiroplasma sp. Moj TaxID=1922342 RepID=UPI0039EF5B63|nr:hypothetical protein [Spiroplasma sp. Moj]